MITNYRGIKHTALTVLSRFVSVFEQGAKIQKGAGSVHEVCGIRIPVDPVAACTSAVQVGNGFVLMAAQWMED